MFITTDTVGPRQQEEACKCYIKIDELLGK